MAYPHFPDINFNYNIPYDRVHYNVRYGPHVMQRLNIYKSPIQNSTGNPVIVFMHGGGWSSNDKTRTVEGATNFQKALFSFLMDPQWVTGGPDGPSASAYVLTSGVDIVSIEWRQYAYTQFGFGGPETRSSIYEEQGVPVNDGASTGNVATTHATFPTMYEDPQIAVQWVKDNAERYGFDSTKIFSWGSSAGGNGVMVAGLRPSRRFKPKHLTSHKFDRSSSSDVIGILNWYGQISMNPYYFPFTYFGAVFGLMDANDGGENGATEALWRKRRDVERILLKPDASGSISPSSELSPIGKTMSPSSMIVEFPWVNKNVKIYSYYREAEDSLGPNGDSTNGWFTYEGIPPNGISSPWVGGGHEWRQIYDLSAVCEAYGISHDGRVARAPGSIYPAFAPASAEPYTLNGELLTVSSFIGGQFNITLPTGAGLTATQVASSIVTQASAYQIGADVVDASVVIRTSSGTNDAAVAIAVNNTAASGPGRYSGSSAFFVLNASSTGLAPLGMTAGLYRGSVLNQINENYNPINHEVPGYGTYFHTSEQTTTEREIPRMYQWIKKTCGFTYIDDLNLWSDPIK
jgi:hypothetical protein